MSRIEHVAHFLHPKIHRIFSWLNSAYSTAWLLLNKRHDIYAATLQRHKLLDDDGDDVNSKGRLILVSHFTGVTTEVGVADSGPLLLH